MYQCYVPNCTKEVTAKGLCETHYKRLQRHGHLEETRPKGWGEKEKHPLYNSWSWFKRKHVLCKEWGDFFTFVKDIGTKKEGFRLFQKDNSVPIGPSNYIWKQQIPDEHKNKYMKIWRDQNLEHCRNKDLLRNYGISSEDFNEIFEAQKGVCAICGQEEDMVIKGKKVNLAVDHNHETKAVRGLLCHKCNRGLGLFRDSISNLEQAVSYLKSFS